MKQQETMLNTHFNGNKIDKLSHDEIGDDHISTGLDTPMKKDAFVLNDAEKKRKNFRLIFSNNECYGIRFN
jgi:GTP cyclohydrolase I